jgi:hypothetical protein
MLPVWVVLYLIVFFSLEIWDSVDGRRNGRSIGVIMADIASTIMLGAVFAGFFFPALIEPLGRSALPLFALALGYLGIHTSVQLLRTPPDPELSPRADAVAGHFGVLVAALFMAPAVAFGTLAALRAW